MDQNAETPYRFSTNYDALLIVGGEPQKGPEAFCSSQTALKLYEDQQEHPPIIVTTGGELPCRRQRSSTASKEFLDKELSKKGYCDGSSVAIIPEEEYLDDVLDSFEIDPEHSDARLGSSGAYTSILFAMSSGRIERYARIPRIGLIADNQSAARYADFARFMCRNQYGVVPIQNGHDLSFFDELYDAAWPRALRTGFLKRGLKSEEAHKKHEALLRRSPRFKNAFREPADLETRSLFGAMRGRIAGVVLRAALMPMSR